MQKSQSIELKNLIIFLLVVITITALTWFVLEAFEKKPIKNNFIKVKSSKNLAVENDSEVEKVPIADENFEVYQFKDPFLPLSKETAPAENVPPSASEGTTGDETQSNSSAPNTAIRSASNPQVVSIRSVGNTASATVIIKGKKINVVEGQTVQGYTIVDIDKATNTVEMIYGDEKVLAN